MKSISNFILACCIFSLMGCDACQSKKTDVTAPDSKQTTDNQSIKADDKPRDAKYEDYGHRWGFIDTSGKMLIPFQYEDAGDFSEGLAAVRIGDFWGYINKKAELVIPATFKGAWDFKGGMARVLTVENKVGYLDKKGRWAITPNYENATDFKENLAVVETEKGFTYINTDGKTPISTIFEQASPFEKGLAKVRLNDKVGLINKNGSYVLKPNYQLVTLQKNGFIRYETDHKTNVCTSRGEAVSLPKGIKVVYYRPNAILVATASNPKLVDKKGKILIDSTYEEMTPLLDTLWAVRDDGKTAIYSNKGVEIIPFKFNQLYQFSEQKVAFQIGDKWGFMDAHLNIVTEPQYKLAWSFCNQFARVVGYDGFGYVNRKGVEVIAPQFQDAKDFSEGLARVMKRM
jgi:WG containing repeat